MRYVRAPSLNYVGQVLTHQMPFCLFQSWTHCISLTGMRIHVTPTLWASEGLETSLLSPKVAGIHRHEPAHIKYFTHRCSIAG